MNIVDIVILAILGLSILVGLYRGFISSVASMGGCLLSLGLSFWLSPKLAGAIQNNPDDVMDFMKQLTTGLYKELDKQMKGTTLKSTYSIYNDKQMTKDIDNYKKLIKTWEDKVADLEDRYYKQFSAMEKQLAQMQSSTSALSSLMGTS